MKKFKESVVCGFWPKMYIVSHRDPFVALIAVLFLLPGFPWERSVFASPMNVSFMEFSIIPQKGDSYGSSTGATVEKVQGPLKTTVLFFSDDQKSLCLITSPFGISEQINFLMKSTVSKTLHIPENHVFPFSNHNHCAVKLAEHDYSPWEAYSASKNEFTLTARGKEFFEQLQKTCEALPCTLQPATLHWAVAQENRFTYNRKGRRADGSTYFMREEHRVLLGEDFNGDIEQDAFVLCFKNDQNKIVGFLTQYTGHPVTSYHPEHPIASGEWPQFACEYLSSRHSGVPVGFLQGCAGDSNSKYMLSGDTSKSDLFGMYLGQTFIRAAGELKPSNRKDFDLRMETAKLPYAELPSLDHLQNELAEIDDFITRAKAGDEKTLHCVGLNFPRALSPVYRARLVEQIRPWTVWALNIRKTNQTHTLPQHLEIPIVALRIGDVGIVGLPCEPFLQIGRLVKKNSPLPLTIPCGYLYSSYGYIPDSGNAGDREYMSAFYRYTGNWPPFQRPAGDILAEQGIRMLQQMAN